MNFRRISYKALLLIGLDVFRFRKDDRRVLEGVIIPALARDPKIKRVLFVGCDFYTKRYEGLFRDKEYWTIEVQEKLRKYGAKNHAVGPLEELHLLFGEEFFDCVICNGVYGWGLNSAEAIESAFDNCFTRMRRGGILILGWDDIPERCPYPLTKCRALSRFEPFDFRPLGGSVHLTRTKYRHVYSFFCRR